MLTVGEPLNLAKAVIAAPSVDVGGWLPLLLDLYSCIADDAAVALDLYVVLRWLRCSDGTARSTTSSIKPAMARTIITSMIVKPD